MAWLAWGTKQYLLLPMSPALSKSWGVGVGAQTGTKEDKTKMPGSPCTLDLEMPCGIGPQLNQIDYIGRRTWNKNKLYNVWLRCVSKGWVRLKLLCPVVPSA